MTASDRSVHIAVDGHRLICEPNTSGASYLTNLLSIWTVLDDAPQISVLLPFQPNEPCAALQSPHIRIIVANPTCDPMRAFRWQVHWQEVGLPKLIRQCKPDVYLSPYHLTPLLPLKVPVVTTIHDLCCMQYPFVSTGSFVHRAELLSARLRAQRLICVSEFTFGELSRYYPAAARRASVVQNGTDAESISDVSARQNVERFGLRPGNYFLWIGSPTPRKNVGLLLESFARYEESHSSRRLAIVAPATSHTHLRQTAAALKIDGKLDLLNPVGGAIRDSLYRCATALVFPSLCEGFGFPILEAAAQGCPTIAGAHTPAAEILGGTETLASQLTVEAFVPLMRRWASISEADREAEAARLRARAATFSCRRMAIQTLTALRDAAFAGRASLSPPPRPDSERT